MFRFFYVIIMNLFRAPVMIPRMRIYANHPEKYDEVTRYRLCQHVVDLMNHTGRISTIATGLENLPTEGGYVMYPNHQGKYDALGIIKTHEQPCSLVIDFWKSYGILVREFVDLVQGKRLKKKNIRQSLTIILEVAKDVSNGKKYILFPEGGYQFNNQNRLQNFKAGSFKAAVKAKAPIVPVCIIDSYKVFNSFQHGPITTYVHYLPPLYYEEYKGLKTQDIATLVKDRIQQKIDEETKNGSDK